MAQPNALNFSNSIRTHAIFVGVIFTLETIARFAVGASWDQIPVPAEAPESFKDIKIMLLFSGAVDLLFTIVYWIGFLKKVRPCITVCQVYVGLGFALQVLGLLGAMVQLNALTIIMLIVVGTNGYILLVLAQLREMMLNGLLADSAQV